MLPPAVATPRPRESSRRAPSRPDTPRRRRRHRPRSRIRAGSCRGCSPRRLGRPRRPRPGSRPVGAGPHGLRSVARTDPNAASHQVRRCRPRSIRVTRIRPAPGRTVAVSAARPVVVSVAPGRADSVGSQRAGSVGGPPAASAFLSEEASASRRVAVVVSGSRRAVVASEDRRTVAALVGHRVAGSAVRRTVAGSGRRPAAAGSVGHRVAGSVVRGPAAAASAGRRPEADHLVVVGSAVRAAVRAVAGSVAPASRWTLAPRARAGRPPVTAPSRSAGPR